MFGMMNRDRYWYRFLMSLSGYLLHFLSGSTRDWAKEEVDELVSTWGEGEHDLSDAPEGVFLASQPGTEPDGSDPEDPFPSNLTERGKVAVTLALNHRLKSYWLILVAPVTLLILTKCGLLRLSWASYGLVFDMFGAVIVARGILRRPREVSRQNYDMSPTHPYGSPEELLVTAAETVDGVIGVFLLLIGFTFQFIGGATLMSAGIVIVLLVLIWGSISRVNSLMLK